MTSIRKHCSVMTVTKLAKSHLDHFLEKQQQRAREHGCINNRSKYRKEKQIRIESTPYLMFSNPIL